MHDDAEGERAEHEVQPGESQQDATEAQRERHIQRQSAQHAEPRREARVLEEDRNDIRADREEALVSERKLAGRAIQQVESHDQDEEDADRHQRIGVEPGGLQQQERGRRHREQDHEERDVPHLRVARIPCGRNTRIAISTIIGTTCFSSPPVIPGKSSSRFSSSPRSSPPSSGPATSSSPPMR